MFNNKKFQVVIKSISVLKNHCQYQKKNKKIKNKTAKNFITPK